MIQDARPEMRDSRFKIQDSRCKPPSPVFSSPSKIKGVPHSGGGVCLSEISKNSEPGVSQLSIIHCQLSIINYQLCWRQPP